MVVLVPCKFDDDTIKNGGTIVFTISPLSSWETFSSLKGN